MATEFVHLHQHTDYSMLDGACKISKLAEKAAAFGMKAMAVTDHGNMCGAFDAYTMFGKVGVKPILGCEFYMAPGDRREKSRDRAHHKGFHLVLLAATDEGYRNLCRMNAIANLEGFYFNPRIDKETLAAHTAGVIGMTACIGGEVPQAILAGNLERARSALDDYVQILGKENVFVELQNHGMEEERQANRGLIQLARDFNLPLVATNDAHYLERSHAASHDVLLCVGTQKLVSDTSRMKFPSEEFYVKSPEEMAALFTELPEAITNTLEVADRCNVKLELNVNHYPVYEPPDGEDRERYLRRLCIEALPERYNFELDRDPAQLPPERRAVIDRLDHELKIIERMGFTSYFLVVWDFLHYARQQGIPVGPGRGSGAGSIVAYLLHITDIDPLHYQLLFERFLNPERVSPPDFDIDLCERRRVEVIEYVRRKYGEACVAQIGTFGTLKAKAVIKDVARVMGRSFDEGNKLTKVIPADPKMTLAKAKQESPELQELLTKEEWVQTIFQYAEPLEGLNRNMSIHAAGVIIGDQELANVVPLAKGQGDEVITQFSAFPCEELGLLKMDFLGLRTLTIIQDTCDIIEKVHGITIPPSEIPMTDQKTFDLLNQGRTVCVFQLESGGMQDLCRRFGVDRIEDIIALIALYRPGPMQFLDDFIARKTGQKRIEYDTPDMEPILSETYGIMLYQEQVMQVVQRLGNFTLGGADIVRRAMGKKKVKVLEEQFLKFEQGCLDNGLDKATAKAIWDKIMMFAGYGFNKSHSAAYAFLAYRTAFLKANYPTEFMAANLTSEMGTSDRVAELIRECREMHIDVLPPDVNTSFMGFTVDGGAIRFGLAAIKGVGNAAAESILTARKDGPFESLQDLCERAAHMNRRLLESLCQCGALDCFGLKRSQMFEIIEDTISRAHSTIQDRAAGQANFFDLLSLDDGSSASEVPVPEIPEWDGAELLKLEKALLGFYVTGHPLDRYAEIIRMYGVGTVLDAKKWADNRGIRLGGLIAGLSIKYSKRDGRPWAIMQVEDEDSSIECLAYSETYAECMHAIVDEAPVFVEGYVSRRDDEDKPKIVATKVIPIEEGPRVYTREVLVRVPEKMVQQAELLPNLQALLARFPGETPLVLCVLCEAGYIAFVQAAARHRVAVSPDLQQALDTLLGEECWKLKVDRHIKDREPKQWERSAAAAS